MAARSTDVTDVRELLRRLSLGETERQVARDLGLSRLTVRKYRRWAREAGLLAAPPPSEADLERLLEQARVTARPPQELSQVEPFRERVVALVRQGVEARAIWQLLVDERAFTGSYWSVQRFVRRLRQAEPPGAVVRVEVAPGAEAQVDFGFAGPIFDPQRGEARRAWVFVMTLSHSRHQYAEVVYDQSIETWTRLHVAAFEFFGGVPTRVVLDNLRAAIVHASVHDPEVQRSYRDLAEHYGFIVSPCRPRTPQHEGKVEQGGVHYVKRNALAGRTFHDFAAANEHLRRWCLEIAGRRTHGTTRQVPLEVFEQVERPALQQLPPARWEACTWKRAKLHRDGHVVFERSYYSGPHRFIGQRLMVRATAKLVQLFHEHELVATHSRARRPGSWCTFEAHLPPEKVAFLTQSPAWCRQRAGEIGPSTRSLVDQLLGDRPVDRLRSAQGVLRLAQAHGASRLEAACARALAFGEVRYHAVKRILAEGLDRQSVPHATPLEAPGEAPRHARPWTDFFPEAVASEGRA